MECEMSSVSDISFSQQEQDQQMKDANVLTKEQLYRRQKELMRKQLHIFKQQMHYYNGIPFADCCDPLPNNQ
jgi:hypothetical protein